MHPSQGQRPVVVGITGASGSVLARETIELLLANDVPVMAVASSAARLVWAEEMDETLGEALERWGDMGEFTHYPVGDLRAPMASGTFPTASMAVVPCSMASVAAIARGHADNLLRRAADVTLTEKRPPAVVPRYSPPSICR